MSSNSSGPRRWSRWCSRGRRLACAPCSSTDGSQRAAAARPGHPALVTPDGHALLRAAARRARGPGAAELIGPRRGARQHASGSRSRPGSTSPARCMRACCSALPRCRSTRACRRPNGTQMLRCAATSSSRSRCRPRSPGVRAIAERTGRGRRAGERHDLDATALVMHTSGSSAAPKPVELTYGNLLWSALGSAVALGAPDERALAVRDAALPHGRPLDPRAQRDLRDHRRGPRAASSSTATLRRAARASA